MMKKYGILIVLMALIGACSPQNEKEKHQSSRNNVINVKNQIKEIDTENEVLIGSHSRATYTNDYLIIRDHHAWNGVIHLFDKTDFHYLTSAGNKGEGPDELTIVGNLYVDEARKKIYIADNGKNKIFSYDIDSIIAMPDIYRHQLKTRINGSQFPNQAIYINDTLSYCTIIVPTSFQTFDQMIGKWNMLTGEIKTIGEKHPDTHQKRSKIAVSMEKKMIVEAYYNYDLMNISDLDGNIQCYIYGPDWETKGLETFGDVMITPNHILVGYSGEKWATAKSKKIHVFDLKGNYQKTLDIGYAISSCCYDKTHHRLFMVFDDEIQFGYLNLEGII